MQLDHHLFTVVPVCTPIFLFFRSSSLDTVEAAGTAMSWLASKYGSEKSMVCLRSSVMVMADTSTSRSPWASAVKAPSHGVLTNFTSNPAFWAPARSTSMSKPTISPFSF